MNTSHNPGSETCLSVGAGRNQSRSAENAGSRVPSYSETEETFCFISRCSWTYRSSLNCNLFNHSPGRTRVTERQEHHRSPALAIYPRRYSGTHWNYFANRNKFTQNIEVSGCDRTGIHQHCQDSGTGGLQYRQEICLVVKHLPGRNCLHFLKRFRKRVTKCFLERWNPNCTSWHQLLVSRSEAWWG